MKSDNYRPANISDIIRVVPVDYRSDVEALFRQWNRVYARNRALTELYRMNRKLQDLGITEMPESLKTISCVLGWPKKAVDVMAVRSQFEGYVFAGHEDVQLNSIVRDNHIATKYSQACTSSLIHGLSTMTVMRGVGRQPAVVIRAYSANQSCVLWDKDTERVHCGIVATKTNSAGVVEQYVVHEPDAVLTLTHINGSHWACQVEYNPMGRPLIEPLIFDADLDRPLGHSRITPEVIAITDKAMRDVMNMEVGAAFWTWPRMYMLGLDPSVIKSAEDLDKEKSDEQDTDDQHMSADVAKTKMDMYLHRVLAISKDADGDIPTVGQFQPLDVSNLTAMFENDAQRFSGATNVPIGQLGVMSRNYTSSDALGAANDPLILDVERMNSRNKDSLEEIARMAMAVAGGVSIDQLSEHQKNVQAYLPDPSMPTLTARADAWTKICGADKDLVGTRVYYEGLGLTQATIDRLMAQKQKASVMESINAMSTMFDEQHEE